MLRLLSIGSDLFQPLTFTLGLRNALRTFTPTTYSTNVLAQTKAEEQELKEKCEGTTQVLRNWGCSDDDLMRIFTRCPALRNADPSKIQSKLCLLSDLGLGAPQLVKIINCRPRFFQSRINHNFDDRLASLMSLFESKEMLQKAIARNPSLLCEFQYDIEGVVAVYENLGVNKRDLVQMMLLRPTIISRTSFDNEKLEYISRIGISKDTKMYKYVVALIGISRVTTIREKVLNLTKFGLSEDEVFVLFGKSLNILTLSTDKVQRNMTFILGTMKLEVKMVLKCPYLLLANLDTVLKPRALLAMKIQDMDSKLQLPTIFKGLRMSEDRFLNSFVRSHDIDKEIADELIEFYTRTKEVKRLAESSKSFVTRGFPF